jgi:hypothetical protein
VNERSPAAQVREVPDVTVLAEIVLRSLRVPPDDTKKMPNATAVVQSAEAGPNVTAEVVVLDPAEGAPRVTS